MFGDIQWLIENPEIGWIAVLLYLVWEIRGPRGKISQLTMLIENVVVVVRGLARAQNNDEKVDVEKVDSYLVENGHEPSDFINENSKNRADEIIKEND